MLDAASGKRHLLPMKRAGWIGRPDVATPTPDSNAPSAMKRSSILQAAGVRLTTALDGKGAQVVATTRI